MEEENRKLRDQNFEFRNKARAAELVAKTAKSEMQDKDKQLKIMTDQNSELLRLLESEEAANAKLEVSNKEVREELEVLKDKYSNLLTTAKTHEGMAAKAAREGQLRAEELRLLRAEAEQLRSQNSEMKRKAQVELETLQEQLRVRKEKQYHLAADAAGAGGQAQAEDQVAAMEQKMRTLHAKNVELSTQLQVETRSNGARRRPTACWPWSRRTWPRRTARCRKRSSAPRTSVCGWRARRRTAASSCGRWRRRSSSCWSGLAAELGKTKAVETPRQKEQEVLAIKKKNARLLKESTAEGKARVKAELDKKVLIDQVQALKNHNKQLAGRCREEVKEKLNEQSRGSRRRTR